MLLCRSSCSRHFAVPAVASLYASHSLFSISLYPSFSQHLSSSVRPGMTSKLNQNDIEIGFTGHYTIKNPLVCESGILECRHSGLCGTALQAASSKGHDKIVEMLLAYDATVKAPGRSSRPDGGDALQASSGWHGKIVKMLLAKGATANASSRRYGTALQAASSGEHDKIVETFPEGQYTHGRRLGVCSNNFTVRTSA